MAKLLLVDDRPANLLALRSLLEDLGHALMEARSGEEALRLLLQDDFALVLLDVQMEGLDGYETARLIRSRERSRRTPIVFITAYESDRQTTERAYELGAVDFLVKPLSPVVLRAKVMVLVDLFEKAEQARHQAEQLREIEREQFEQRLAEQTVRQAEARLALAAIVETSEDAIIGKTLEGVITSWNAGAEQLYGYTADEVVGRSISLLVPPGRSDELAEVLQRLRRGEKIEHYETERVRKDGRCIDVSIRTSPITDQSGRVTAASVIARDITQQRQSERRRNARLAVTQILAQAESLQEAIPGILQTACESLGWDVGAFWSVDRDKHAIRCLELWHQPFAEIREFEAATRGSAFCPDRSLPGRVWESGEPAWIPNVTADHNFLRAGAAAREGLHGAFACPVRVGTQVLGVVEFFSREIREPDADLLEMMTTIGGQLGQFIERKRAEQDREQALATLDSLIASAPVGIALLDREMRYRLVNGPLAAMNGVPAADHLDRKVAEIVPGLMPVAEPLFRRVLESGTPIVDQTLEGETLAATGEKGCWQESWFPVPGLDGKPSGVGVIVQEITTRKRAEEAIRKQNERLRLLSNVAVHLLTVRDPDSMVRGLFGEVQGHFGLDGYFNFLVNEAGDALRLESYAGVPQEFAATLTRLEFGEAVCGTVALRREPLVAVEIQESDDPLTELVRPLGIRAYACFPLLSGEKLIGTISFASRTRDRFDDDELDFFETISRYLTMAYERLRLIVQLRDADRRKDEFLATLAHELRNPLAPISSAVQVLHLKGPPEPELQLARAVIDRQISQMAHLLDDLLDVSRITRNKLQLRKRRLNLADAIQAAVEQSRPLIDASEHELSVTMPAEPIHVNADPIRLAQILANLLNNAAKYSDAKGHIRLTAERTGEDAVVIVRDDGIGIDAEHLPHIFDLFSQVQPALERSQGGLGIGLSLVRALIEMHGGSIEARSDGPGRGSEFLVRLPRLLAEPEAELEPETNGQPHLSSTTRRILVVDDNPDAAMMLSAMLRIQGHDVHAAHDGQAAVEMAATLRPDVMLLDIGLPRMNGYEACRRIREQPGGDKMMLIALTGWGQEDDKRRAIAAGFNHHFTKPVDIKALTPLLDSLPQCSP